MKKYIYLLLLVAAIIGLVVVLTKGSGPDPNRPAVPDFQSADAKEWAQKIDALCQDGKWSPEGYSDLSNGIHTDWATSQGELISFDEESSLQNYLFAASCYALNTRIDKLFQQSSYPADQVKSAEDALAFLTGKIDAYGSNSNLTTAANILKEYKVLLGSLSFARSASYSRPLRAYNAPSADAARQAINALKYYSSHFSKNTSISQQVNNLAANRAQAESNYYSALERSIENHYRGSDDLAGLLNDQMQFDEICTNSSAKSKLNTYITNFEY